MDWIDQLLNTPSEFEFFTMLAAVLRASNRTWTLQMLETVLDTIRDPVHGYGLQLKSSQDLWRWTGQQRIAWRGITHRYTLYQDNTLQWEILEHPTITGLKNIQDAFRQFWLNKFQLRLTEGTAEAVEKQPSPAPESLEALALNNEIQQPTLHVALSTVTNSVKGGSQ